MSDSSCWLCGVELEESYGVILNLAIIDRQGKHEIIPDEDPTQIICEKCWEDKEEDMNKLFKVL